jgi:hypothetical protein
MYGGSGPPERRSLPVAFDKNAIVQKLVEIVHTDQDGIVMVDPIVPLPASR